MNLFTDTEVYNAKFSDGVATLRDGFAARYWGFVTRLSKDDVKKRFPGLTPEAGIEAAIGEDFTTDAKKINEFVNQHPELEIGSVIECYETFDLDSNDLIVLWRVPIGTKPKPAN